MIREEESFLVSVVVPIHNAAPYLEFCVGSILGQTHRSLEVILVDDGSSDGSSAIADKLELGDSRVCVVHQRQMGVSAARNSGIRRAHGSWITFVDADDWIAPGFVHEMLSVGLSLGTEIVIGTAVLDGPKVGRDRLPRVRSCDGPSAVAALLYPGIPVGCWNKLFHRRLIDELEVLFDETLVMGEGLTFSIDLVQRSDRVAFSDSPLYYYRKDNLDSATYCPTPGRMRLALETIEIIENNLLAQGDQVRHALEFHRWRTTVLYLAAQIRHGGSSEGDEYRATVRYLRRNGLRTLLRCSLTMDGWLESLVAAVFPALAAKLLVGRWERRSATHRGSE